MTTCVRPCAGDCTSNCATRRSSAFVSQSLCSSDDNTIYEKPGRNICCDVVFGENRHSAGECCMDDMQLPTEPPPRICVEELEWTKPPERIAECTIRPGDFIKDRSLKFRCDGSFKGCIEIPDEKKPNKIGLGNPVGVSFGSFALNYLKPSDEYKVLQGYATCLVAYGEIFITPEHEWTIIIINKILDEGKQLIENSLINNSELTESNVTKRFVLCKNTMEIEIFEPCFMGKIISDDITIPNLKESLEKFFIKEKYCILWIGDYYFLIWKTMGLYFCFDCYGRDPKKLCMDLQAGFASLLCLRKIINIYYLISNLSNVYPEQMFTIRRIKMIKLLPCCEMAEQIDDHERKIEYEIVNNGYARLYGRLHLGSECFREFRFKQSLAVAVIGIIYSKIDATCTWDGYIVDQVLLLGTDYYKRWTFCDHCFDLGIQDIPGKFQIGQFTVEIVVNPIQESGQWQCIPNFRHSALTKAVKHAFQNSLNLLLQIERKTYALWRRNNFYYLLDPYEHQGYTGAERTKTSVLHMCNSINLLCCKLTQVILEIPSSRPFYIHWLKICSVIKTIDIKCQDKNEIEPSCITKRPIALNDEVVSLNESIIDLRCKKEFYCLLDKGEIQEEPVADLDSPGISETQVVPTYWNVKCKVMGNLDEMPFPKEPEEESEISELASGLSGEMEEGEGEEMDEEGEEEFDDDEDAGGDTKRKGKGKGGSRKQSGLKGKNESSRDRKKGGKESDDDDGGKGNKSSRKGKRSKGDDSDDGGGTGGKGGGHGKSKGKDGGGGSGGGGGGGGKGGGAGGKGGGEGGGVGGKGGGEGGGVGGKGGGEGGGAGGKGGGGAGGKGGGGAGGKGGGEAGGRNDAGGKGVKGSKGYKSSRDSDQSDGNRSGAGGKKGGKGPKDTDDSDGARKGGKGRKDIDDADGGKKGGKGRKDTDDSDGGKKGGKGRKDTDDLDGEKKGGKGRKDTDDSDGGKKGGKGRKDTDDADGGKKGGKGRKDTDDSDGGKKGGKGRKDTDDLDGGKKGGKGRKDTDDSDGGTKGSKGRKDADDSDGGKKGGKGRKDTDDSDGGKKGGTGRKDIDDSDGGKKGGKGYRDTDDSDGGKKGGKAGADLSDGSGKPSNKGGTKGKGGMGIDSDEGGGKVGTKFKPGKDKDDGMDSKGGKGGKDVSERVGKNGNVYLESAKCQPNSYPGYCPVPRNIAVVGSQSGSYESVCNLLKTGFKCADRVLLMTPWGNYVVFKTKESLFLFDGCTCNVERFRHLDLTMGTAGLLCFDDVHELVTHVLTGKDVQKPAPKDLKNIIDDICNEFCE